jgi:hypothetical protein
VTSEEDRAVATLLGEFARHVPTGRSCVGTAKREQLRGRSTAKGNSLPSKHEASANGLLLRREEGT